MCILECVYTDVAGTYITLHYITSNVTLKCWNSKFEKGVKSCKFINGLTGDVKIAEAFAEHFNKNYQFQRKPE